MTTPCVTRNDGWTGFPGVNGDDPAANPATTDPISILDTVDVPIVVLRRDFMLVGFNKAAAGVLRPSPSGIGSAGPVISGRPTQVPMREAKPTPRPPFLRYGKHPH